MSQPAMIPAWKRLGLKVKENIIKDPLTGQVQASAPISNNKRQSPSTTSTDTPKKPPKRVKLPKAERKPPPEADQLAYLRQYHTDRSNWKFSKQKQNWILRSVFGITTHGNGGIPDEYKDALMSYLEGLQGGAKDRIVDDAKEVVNQWNEYMTTPEEKPKEEEEEVKETEATDENQQKEKENATTSKDASKEKVTVPPSESKARLAKAIIKNLTGVEVKLELLEDEEVVQNHETEETTKLKVDEEGKVEKEDESKSEKKHKKEKKDTKEKKEKSEKKEKKEKSEKKEKKDKKSKAKKEKKSKDKNVE